MATARWAPNQAAIKQVVTYTFSAPNSVGNHYKATINGKTVTYVSVADDTAALAATGLFNLLNVTTSIAPEFTEITWANPSDGVITATAKTAGTPFANLPGDDAGLVLDTGNGLANGITTAFTTANASPSDVNDPENWLRITLPAPGVRELPQNDDDVIIADTDVPMLWNLDQLATVQFNTYDRWQSMTGNIGLPETNPGGYTEWRATRFKFVGPQGSTPAGGLVMTLGYNRDVGSGPSRERYDLGSQKVTLNVLAAGSPVDEFAIDFVGVHTENKINLHGGVALAVAPLPGNSSNLDDVTVAEGSSLTVGPNVVWTSGAVLTTFGGAANLGAAPATITGNNGTVFTITEDGLTWATVTLQGGCTLNMRAGGTITTLTLSSGSTLDKSRDSRALTITNHTIDGNDCRILDPLNSITFTNAGTVKEAVASGPYQFTGDKTVKVT